MPYSVIKFSKEPMPTAFSDAPESIMTRLPRSTLATKMSAGDCQEHRSWY